MKEIAFERVTKQFASKKALDDVSLSFSAGSIHALLGENGAGKSTLAALLSGAVGPSSGCIKIDGAPVVFRSPRDSAAAGIAMVHQRPLLAEELPVWENVILGAEPLRTPAAAGILNKRAAAERIKKLRARFEIAIPLDPNSAVFDLSADAVFYTALLAALFREPQLLILDEPSAALDDASRNLLYACLSAEAARGTGIIVITHNLREAVLHADTITVLKKGQLSAGFDNARRTVSAADILPHLFASAVSGVSVSAATAAAEAASLSAPVAAVPMLTITELSARPRAAASLFGVSFRVAAGRMTVIAGQRESGMETLENCITGARRVPCSGTYSFGNGAAVPFKKKRLSAALLRKRRAGIIPFDRTFGASNPGLTVAQVAGIYEAPANVTAFAEKLIRETGISINASEPAANLSGGMLQRLILARELYYKPKLLVLSEPFQGLDTPSSVRLAELLQSVCRSGAAILVLTSDASFLSGYETDSYVLTGGKLDSGGSGL